MNGIDQGLSDCYQRALELGGRALPLLDAPVSDEMVQSVSDLLDERGQAISAAAELLGGRCPEGAAKQLLEQLLRQQETLKIGFAATLTAIKRSLESSGEQRGNMEGVSRLLAPRTRSRLVNEVR